ncbi:MAG: hypothetical protein FWC35_02125, partial [Proteobacteria bacterium]|nr:hypothetical protein [Pseudomonadota bacterium]
ISPLPLAGEGSGERDGGDGVLFAGIPLRSIPATIDDIYKLDDTVFSRQFVYTLLVFIFRRRKL